MSGPTTIMGRVDVTLDRLMGPPPKPHTVPCDRCGVIRQTHGAVVDPICVTCKHTDNGSSAPTVVGRTPCYKEQLAFHALESGGHKALKSKRMNAASALRKLETIKHIEKLASEFCGECWFKDGCAEWAEAEGYDGVAGGAWLKGGTPLRDQVKVPDPRPDWKIRKAQKERERIARLRATDPEWVERERVRKRQYKRRPK